MQAEQFMTGESESYNYSCKVGKKKGWEKRLATVASEGSLFVFWLVYTML